MAQNIERGNCKTIQKKVINAIRNGIPYEEKPQGDLISREALKKALNNEIGDHALSIAIDRVIDNI